VQIVRRSDEGAQAPLGSRSGSQRTPLTEDEQARAERNFVPYVAENLAAHGRLRVTADTPEMVELFQRVARRVGDQLGRPVVSVANGREITISFGLEEDPGLTGPGARSLPE
jgi:hypothetical protein